MNAHVRVIPLLLLLLMAAIPARAQLAPDKLVFESDDALLDSLKRTEYPYLFPIWGDKVRKMGFTMPLSAGLGVNYLWQESDLRIENISIGFNEGPMVDLSNVVRIESAEAWASGVNLRPDVWLFPFLNVYGILAVAKTRTTIDASFWLPDSANNWQQVTTFSSQARFEAQTFGFGLTPTMGLGGGWVAFDMNFAWSDVSALDEPAFSFVFGPRFGKTFKLANPEQAVAVWVGAFRLNIASETNGSVSLSDVLPLDGLQEKVDQGFLRVEEGQQQVNAWWTGLSDEERENPANRARYEAANRALETAGTLLTGIDGALSDASSATVQYALDKGQLKKRNFIVGGQYQFNEHWMVRGEYGFLGARHQFIGGLQYRFGL